MRFWAGKKDWSRAHQTGSCLTCVRTWTGPKPLLCHVHLVNDLVLIQQIETLGASIESKAEEVRDQMESVAIDQERCCQAQSKALEGLQESLDKAEALSLPETLFGDISGIVLTQIMASIMQVALVWSMGGIIYTVVNDQYLKARAKQKSTLLWWYLLRENLRSFYLGFLFIALFLLSINRVSRNPLNERLPIVTSCTTALGTVFGGVPFFSQHRVGLQDSKQQCHHH